MFNFGSASIRENAPIDFIFGMGAAIGFFIGFVVVYQILYTEVTNHLPQYATLKAMGFSDRYLLFVSDLVLAECGDGDEDAASERLNILEGIDVLQTTAAANELAASLIEAHAVPKSEPRDALHIALAAINGIDYLATWNFKHIMNPSTQHLIDAVCRNAGIESATICTPEQLWVTYDDT